MSKSWEQILGGYATDTLTEEEKRQLFEAALHDQALFDALADEEALKVLLADPEERQRILDSLLASEESHGSARTYGATFLSWFRKSSSLAWAWSIAATGLALIFGWQMNKDWGPTIQQEMEAERSVSDDKKRDDHEMVFRTQAPGTVEMKEPNQNFQEQDQSQSERIAGLTAPVPSPLLSSIAKATKEGERMRQPLAQGRSEDMLRQEFKKERRLKAEKSMSRPPASAIVQNFAGEEPMAAPSVASPEAKEKGSQQLARVPFFAERLQDGDTLSSPSAKELFYANKSRQVDVVGEELNGMRTQQLLGGLPSQANKGFSDEVLDLKKSQEIDQEDSSRQTRGIRYRFVRRAVDGKDEAINMTEFSGKWSDLHLAIESNVSGHLYVLTSFGKGKWQWVRPGFSNIQVSSDGSIQVKSYQSVNFALSHVTNTLGKPVVSIAVLLSSTPLADLGKWLGSNLETPELQIELADGAVFVVQPTPKNENPLRLKISLAE